MNGTGSGTGTGTGRRKKLKINSSIERDTSNLPHDIIKNIVSRLPVKSLLKFKCVSKPWYSLISDSKFARIHLLQSKNNLDSGTLIYSEEYANYHFLKFTNLNFELERFEFPAKKYKYANVLCSCDGLILLKNIHCPSDKMFVIWNPSTRKYIKFSCPYQDELMRNLYGLCYDAYSDDYKFVLLISKIPDFVCYYVVYSYKNNSWSNKKDFPLECNGPPFFPGEPGLFVNGALHWVTTMSRKDSDSTNVKEGSPVYEYHYNNIYGLCCFDPKDDNFKKMSTPTCFDDSSVFRLTSLEGQLCLYRNNCVFDRIDIWMMKDDGKFNSWTKLLTIDNIPKPHDYYARPLCLINKCIVALFIYDEVKPRVVVFNLVKNMFHEMDELPKDIYLNPLLCWNNSLILPNRIIKN